MPQASIYKLSNLDPKYKLNLDATPLNRIQFARPSVRTSLPEMVVGKQWGRPDARFNKYRTTFRETTSYHFGKLKIFPKSLNETESINFR